MRPRVWFALSILLAFFASAWSPAYGAPENEGTIHGRVMSAQRPVEGAFLGAHLKDKSFTFYVASDSQGQFLFKGLAPGVYEVSSYVAGFRTVTKDAVTVEEGKQPVVNFQIQPEIDPANLIEQMTNSELLTSFPGTQEQKNALDYRCDYCHGAYYIAKSRFTRQDWAVIVRTMQKITPVGDLAPPRTQRFEDAEAPQAPQAKTHEADQLPNPPNSDDESIVNYLTQIRGPESPVIVFKPFPRPTGTQTRVRITEYQIPRPRSVPHDIQLDRNGNVWYSQWKADAIGRLDPKTGEIREFPAPAVAGRPAGILAIEFDRSGMMWLGQLWSGRILRFDPQTEKYTGAWSTPVASSRPGMVGCIDNNGDVWDADSVADSTWRLNPTTGKFTRYRKSLTGIDGYGIQCDSKGNVWLGGITTSAVVKFDPQTEKLTKYPTPTATSGPRRLTIDKNDNVWFGEWYAGKIGFLDAETGKITEYTPPSPYAHAYHAVSDSKTGTAWNVPFGTDRVTKVDPSTGIVTEFPLPMTLLGNSLRNAVVDSSTNPPSLWFLNQRFGKIVRFQEY